jgi:hypothetical protein
MEFPHVPEGGQGQRFRLRLEPQDPVLPVGGSFLVNCTTDCPQPQLINLETSLSKEARDHGVGWAAFLLSNVTDDSQIHCSGYCNGSQIATSSGITVFSEWTCLHVGTDLSSAGSIRSEALGSGNSACSEADRQTGTEMFSAVRQGSSC